MSLLCRSKAVVAFWLVAGLLTAPLADGSLLAFLNFENQLAVESSVCPRRSDIDEEGAFNGASGQTLPSISSDQARIGVYSAYFPGSGSGIELGTWNVASVRNEMSLAVWFRATDWDDHERLIAKGSGNEDNNQSWQLAIARDYLLRRQPRCLINVYQLLPPSVVANIFLELNTWYHVVCTYELGAMRIYVNGVLRGTSSSGNYASITEDPQHKVIVGNSASWNRPYTGYIDELRVYDHRLSDSDVAALFSINAQNRAPQISLAAYFNTTVLEPLSMSPDVTDPEGDNMTYQWTFTVGCDAAELSSPTSKNVDIKFNKIQRFDFLFSASDGELCTATEISVDVAGNAPFINKALLPTELVVHRGRSAELTAIVTGYPAPDVRWQYYTTVNVTDDNSTASERLGRNLEQTMFDYLIEKYRNNPADLMPEDCAAIERAINERATTEDWVDIPDQTSNTFISPIGTPEIDGMLIRIRAINFVSQDVSDPIVLAYDPDDLNDDEADEEDLALVIGLAVGLGSAFLCCLVCIAAVALVALRKRQRQRLAIRLREPDYEPLMYGDYLDAPLHKDKPLSKKKRQALEALDQLVADDEDIHLGSLLCIHGEKDAADATAKALVVTYIAHGKAYRLLERIIVDEVARTIQEATLFRANSMASKMFKTYAQIVALPYLWRTLARPVNELHALSKQHDEGSDDDRCGSYGMSSILNLSMEVDPRKMDEASDPTVNTLQLWLIAQKILASIVRSDAEVPEEIRAVLKLVFNEVRQKFPGEEYKAIGGFLFLRFICPSLLAPHVYGLLEGPPNETAQRQFILIGKVLQNLSNGTLPGQKEDFMEKLNDFITTNQEALRNFYERIMDSTGPLVNPEIPDNARLNALVCLSEVAAQNRDEIREQLRELAAGDFVARTDQVLQQL